jgi:hypothetical protein
MNVLNSMSDIAYDVGNFVLKILDVISKPIADLIGVTPRKLWIRLGVALLLGVLIWLLWRILSAFIGAGSRVDGNNIYDLTGLLWATVFAYLLLAGGAFLWWSHRRSKQIPQTQNVEPQNELIHPIHSGIVHPATHHDLNAQSINIQKEVQIEVERMTPIIISRAIEERIVPLIDELRVEIQTIKTSAVTSFDTVNMPLSRKSVMMRFECETADVIAVRLDTNLYWEIELGHEFARGEKEVEDLVMQAMQSALTMRISERTLKEIKISLRTIQESAKNDTQAYINKYVPVKRLDFLIKQMSLPREMVERAVQNRLVSAYNTTDQMSTTNTHAQTAPRNTFHESEAENDSQ